MNSYNKFLYCKLKIVVDIFKDKDNNAKDIKNKDYYMHIIN